MAKEDFRVAFNLKQAAKYLGISTPTLLDIIRSGEIASHRVGKRRWLISKVVLDNWLERSGTKGGVHSEKN